MRSPDTTRRRIWVADDSPSDAERVRRVLSSQYAVEVFNDGATVLERLAAQAPPDLLVCDMVMPGLTGMDVLRYLRAPRTGIPALPILVLTATRDTAQTVEALSAGANDFLSKPIGEPELIARVAALLRTKELLERALKAEESVRSLLANAPDAILAVDAQGLVTYVNAEGVRAVGQPEAAVVGQRLAELLPDLALRNVTVAPGEPLLPLPDIKIGERVFSPSLRILPSDSAANTTIALRDVTTRRQAEARRLDFYSIIAHDLRTPLGAAMLRLEMTFRGKHGVLPAGLIADLRRIEGTLRGLVSMINDFLELARFEGTGYTLEREQVDMGTLVRSTLEDFRPLLDANGLACQLVGAKENAFVAGDRKRLAQVLANLMGNAVKFTPREGTITVSVIPNEDHVEVAVEDTGRGIPDDQLARLFERYYVGSIRGGEGVGSGLGLMIVREIVEAHGGLVGAESRVGEGSRFWFRLPRKRTASSV